MLIQINNYTVSLEPSNNSVKNDAVRHINKEKCAKFKDSPGANNVLLHCVCCIKFRSYLVVLKSLLVNASCTAKTRTTVCACS